MSLRLCIECGAYRPRPVPWSAPCPRCDAAAPAWKPVPLTFQELSRRVVMGTVLAGGAAVAAGAIHVLCSGWLYPPGDLRVFQVVIAVVTLLFGGIGGVLLLREAVEQMFHRDHVHDQRLGDRRGEARAVFGIVRRANGRATRDAGLLAPGTPGLSSMPVFVNMRALAPVIGRALRAPQPKAVDVAVLAALLGLASRGRCELVLRVTRAWQRPSGGVVRREAERFTVHVRRVAGAGALAPEQGWLENALLTALDGLSVSRSRNPPAAPPTVTGPYRSGAPTPPSTSEVPVLVETLMGALTGGRLKARNWLHSVLRAEAAGPSALPYEARLAVASRVSADLAAVLARPASSPAAALLAQIRQGLALGGRAP